MASWASSEEGLSAYFVLFSSLLAFVLVLSKFLHDRPVLASFFPEAGMILLVGMIAGFFVNLFVDDEPERQNDNNNGDGEQSSVAEGLLSFSPEVFFLVLLPPIIFNSGYHLRRELFFRHISPIVLLAVVGTTISTVSIALILQLFVEMDYTGGFRPQFTELLTFGALISATDPVSTLAVFQAKRVDPQLFYLVFGESVLNDAVGLVLFQAFSQFVERDNGAGKIVIGVGEFIVGFLMDSVGSPILGLFCGCAAAYLFKRIDMRQNKLIELSLYILIMYVPFLAAELLHLSGIVCILFSGMAAKAYVEPNLSDETAEHARVFFRLSANLAETSIFLELGMCVFGMMPGSFHGLFILSSVFACLVARALNVYPIAFVFNKHLREKPEDAAERDEALSPRNSMHSSRHNIEMSEKLNRHQRHDNGYHQTDQKPPSPPPPALMLSDTTDTETPRFRRDLRINAKTAHMLWFSGLRGAVAYACVRSFPDTFGHQRNFVVATMVIVLVTVFTLGSTTELVLSLLNIEMNIDEDKFMEDWYKSRRPATLIRRFEAFVRRHMVRATPSSDVDGVQTSDNSYHGVDSSPTRNGSTESGEQTIYAAHIEMNESDHSDTTTGRPRKRKESLFQYGGKN